MSEDTASETAPQFFYLVIGLGTGFLLGTLFAPMSGEETRASLMNRADELKRQAVAAVENTKTTVAGKKDQIAAALDAGREVYKQEIAKATAAGTET